MLPFLNGQLEKKFFFWGGGVVDTGQEKSRTFEISKTAALFTFLKVDQEQFSKVISLIESGNKEGANMVFGGGRHGDKGYFVQPTVFTDVQDHMRIAKEEVH